MIVNASDIYLTAKPDPDPNVSYLYDDSWKERREQYEKGELSFIGIQACIDLQIPINQSHWWHNTVQQTISSPGLWVVVDDGEDWTLEGDNTYLKTIFEEEKQTLIQMLEAIGIEVEEIGK